MSGGKLPEGWIDTQLGNIVDYGKATKRVLSDVNDDTWVLELEDIEKESSKLLSTIRAGERPFKSTKNSFKKGDVLYGKLRPYLNKIIIAEEDGVCTTEIIPLSAEPSCCNKYIFYWLKSSTFLGYVNDVSYGVNMPRLGTADGLKAPLRLAPLAEQKIIAEKLDTLLAQVDSTKARLEQIPQILKRFRQAILTAAISGRLTDKWRKLTDLQTIWKSYTLGELVTIDRGSSPRPIKDYITTDENGVNWIKIGDTKEGEKYIRSTKERITREGSKKSRKVTPGDFILSNSMSLGRAYIVEIEGYVHDGWFILRLPENIDKNYFYYLLSSSQLQTQFSSLAVGGVVQNIRSELVKQAIVNIPPLQEQAEIVRRVEQLFAYADTIEKQVNNALTRVNSLTQSILAKAFRGELTAQWRAENPDLISGENSAATLLEKIKAERAASGGKKTSRKKA